MRAVMAVTTHEERAITVALAGPPNVGKSTVFNMLTGLSQHVGNWPGKTIERKTGTCRCNGLTLNIVDLPGTYSLTANSPEERLARGFILTERPEVVVVIVNAAALERGLYLVAELLPLPTPLVVALNMMDVAEAQGIRIDILVLEAALGVPVLPLVASRNVGLRDLISTVDQVARRPGAQRRSLPTVREGHRRVMTAIRDIITGHVPAPYAEEWVATKLLEGDDELLELTQRRLPSERWAQVEALLRAHEDAVLDVAGGRYEWITHILRAAVIRPGPGQITWTDRLDRVLTHPLWGFVLLLGLFWVVFKVTYGIGAPIQDWLDRAVIQRAARMARASLGGWSPWVGGLVADGAIGGAGRVLSFLPILGLFFAVMALLEDVGYLARAAFILDRFMHPMGLHGKSGLPLALGFGCNVPAVLGTRIIEDRRARVLTILLAPLVPCSARLAVLAFLAPAFFGEGAVLVSWGLVVFNLIVLALVGVTAHRFVFRGRSAAFIMELPLYHAPNARTIGLMVWRNTLAFVRKAGGVILLVAVAVWTLATLPGGAVGQSYLAQLGRLLAPAGRLMGLNWQMMVALLTSFLAKENVVPTLAILYGSAQDDLGLSSLIAARSSPAAALAFLVVQMLFIPCVATVAAIRSETMSWTWTGASVVLLTVISLGAGIGVYRVGAFLGFAF
jgi:ferrous iron transport protein B